MYTNMDNRSVFAPRTPAQSMDFQFALMEAAPDQATAYSSASTTNFIPKMKKADRLLLVAKYIHLHYDIIRVNQPVSFWYKPFSDDQPQPDQQQPQPGQPQSDQPQPGTKLESQTYRPLTDHQLELWVRDTYLEGFGSAEPTELASAMDMVKIITTKEVERVDNTWAEVMPGVYWSRDLGKLYSNPQAPCFRRLFDTEVGDKHVVKLPAFTKKQSDALFASYEANLKKAEDGSLFEEEPYEFIKTWANGSHDVYLDIVRSIAYCFLKKKPVGSYVLVGLRRNGKSSFVGLLHTIFGRSNTSMVRLSQLGDTHYVNTLANTMMNAPDEEDEKAIDAQANFKTLSDHGLMNLQVMFSNMPLQVHCDFMNFFPMNHIPEWKGTGAAACMKRTLVIPFYADLSAYDKKNYDFAGSTFTPDFMADFMGYVFAFATYYSNHDLEFSRTMLMEQSALEEDADSALAYRKRFEEYFDGFDSNKVLFEDYSNWCKSNDVPIQTLKEMKFVFRDYYTKRVSFTPRPGERAKAYRIARPNHQIMWYGMPKNEAGDLNWLHSNNASMVEQLDRYYELKREELKKRKKQESRRRG